MTQHFMPEDNYEDQRTLRRLGLVVAGFIVFTAAMAIGVGVIMG
jgi:hypothetical protein